MTRGTDAQPVRQATRVVELDLRVIRAATWIYLGGTIALVTLLGLLPVSMSLRRAAAPAASVSDPA